MTGIRRELGTEPRAGRAARARAARPPGRADRADTLAGLRDRALLLLGFAAALRRSELVALDVEDLDFDPAAAAVTIRARRPTRSGQEPRSRCRTRARETIYARSARSAWLEAAGIHRGPGVPADAPRRHAHRPAALRPVGRADRQAPRPRRRRPPRVLSGHSLRAGYATAAAAAGIEERKIANVTRHKNLPVLRRYIRAATAFDDVGEVL